MEIEKRRYIPCLRWKLGEYQAVLRLSPKAKSSINPIIEIPEIGFDFETRQEKKSIDDHLEPFAKRVKQKWGSANFFVDFRLIDINARLVNGIHPVSFVLDDMRDKKLNAIPVVRFALDAESRRAVRDGVEIDGRGVCLRVGLTDLARTETSSFIERSLESCSVKVEESDFIIDLEAPNFEPMDLFADILERIIHNLPHLDQWRSFGILGTSFPSTMAEVGMGSTILPRNEWLLYEMLIARLAKRGLRVPSFGDYVINHPKLIQMDMRRIKPSASVRYTIKDAWLIEKGKNVRDNGYGQYQELCKSIVESKYYSGHSFSYGDDYIYQCAMGKAKTGNLTTWRLVGTNHHIEKIISSFANQNVP
jgi:hypothetical protein